jgi:hypothetical protein
MATRITKATILPCTLPEAALLRSYHGTGAYTDCFTTDLPGTFSHQQFVAAFYATWAFKPEQFILKWLLKKPSTDAQAAQLAAGNIKQFAAWSVEKRAKDQLLLCDFMGSTRSWLMIEAISIDNAAATRLYFGSAVVPRRDRKTGQVSLGPGFKLLLGFHKAYSKILLRAACGRLSTTTSA